MVGVLDALSEPVLCPVDLLTIDRHLHVLHYHPELVVFLLVVDTVVVLDIADPLLLKVKVLFQVVLQHFPASDGKDVCKEYNVFLVKPAVVNLERLIPNIGFRDLVLQSSLVAKVGVLDVRGEPVLGPLDLTQQERTSWRTVR